MDVILHFRLTRCSGHLVLGDLAYTTTLLPGEKVRLFTRDRHSRWSYDSESHLAYRHETTSEESYYTWGMARAMSDLSVSESGSASSSFSEDWAAGGGGASFNFLGIIKIGGGGGSYDARSIGSFARNLRRHAESSSSYVASGVRASSSTSIGEVDRRTHVEGESESQMEASSRLFTNPNRCHAVTYLFYKINKIQQVVFSLEAIERRVDDPAAPTDPDRRIEPDVSGLVAVRPGIVLATDHNRVQIERTAREAAFERQHATLDDLGTSGGGTYPKRPPTIDREPLLDSVRKAAVDSIDKDLITAGIMKGTDGTPNADFAKSLSWKSEELLPTPGILVRGCLDACDTCEPALQEMIALELEEKKLNNQGT